MEWVMRMKKVMIVLLVLAVLLAGLFLWKGGHHALYAAGVLEQWLDADSADQTLTLQLQRGGFSIHAPTGQLRPNVDQWTLTADTFWTEYNDEEICGLTADGITVYLHRGILYTDTGRSYALPELPSLDRLAAGLLLYGRVTRQGNCYTLTMDTEELELTASMTVDEGIRSMTVMVLLPEQTIHATLVPQPTQPHPIPRSVSDAMVRAKTEPPKSLQEPLQVLLPALEGLLPLSGDLMLDISCGILELTERVELTLDQGKAILSRSGIQVDAALPQDLSRLSPAAAALLVLRNADLTQSSDTAVFSLAIPGETATELMESLIPQASGLGIRLTESSLTMTIAGNRLTGAAISAAGEVPFLFTTIPVTFSANLTVN